MAQTWINEIEKISHKWSRGLINEVELFSVFIVFLIVCYEYTRIQNSSSTGYLGAQSWKHFVTTPFKLSERGETPFLKQFFNVFEQISNIMFFKNGGGPGPIPPLVTPVGRIIQLCLLMIHLKQWLSAGVPWGPWIPLWVHKQNITNWESVMCDFPKVCIITIICFEVLVCVTLCCPCKTRYGSRIDLVVRFDH